ncbi:hypothetical protein NGRA_1978 [Nosema granulosis]|uniref:Uncharacterized protein n=1 Tax=Nosema granulosis TaxID=83296 RepID=A0A9P6H072_9MICR|nr:hypothetical protein NGRA_1978 [Nosema granulosis]
MLVKNIIDLDSFMEKITIDSQDKYFSLLFSLIDSPSIQNMDRILSSFSINDLVNSLKHLIKFKYNCLTDRIKSNLVECVELILQYKENVDTLIINCLRLGLVEEVMAMFKRQTKYFQIHKMGFFFLAFHTQDLKLIHKLGVSSRDFYYKRVLQQITTQSPFLPQEIDSLYIPTPVNYISSAISVELELDILFLSNVKSNLDFYKKLILKDFINSEDMAFRVLRFCVYIPYTNNIYLFSQDVVKKYPTSCMALIYDLLFFNGKENISTLTVKWLDAIKTKKAKHTTNFPRLEVLKKLFPDLSKALATVYNNKSIEETTKKIYSLNFTKYYSVITEMKEKNIPFIGQDIYEEIISISQEWDNYMQVYLWKILTFQKILFNFNIPKIELISQEAKEGAEIINSLKKKS